MKKIKLALIGAGQRGAQAYAPYVQLHSDKMEFVAVAEPDQERREEFQKTFHLPKENCYESWDEFFKAEKSADAVLICTQDREHFKPACKAIEQGYHILLEKPISFLEEECEKLGVLAEKYDKVIVVCHVLRYTPFFKKVHELLEQKVIGELQNIQWMENVGYWHQAHSYVRGNWRNSETSSPMILAKCCHDLDLILWLVQSECTKISSFGSLGHFDRKFAPEGAAERCLDGCKAKGQCPYYAPHIYIDWKNDWQADVIKKVVSKDTSDEKILEALKSGPYGRCVYYCDNNVVDHQVVNMEFANGITVSFTMTAFSNECARDIKLMGSKGELFGRLEDNEIYIKNFITGKTEKISTELVTEGHGGGDFGVMEHFAELICKNAVECSKKDFGEALQSHKAAFAAEKSRIEGNVVYL